MARSRNRCCNGKARILSPLMAVGVYLGENDMKVFRCNFNSLSITFYVT